MYGLPQSTLDSLRSVFAKVPALRGVILYGSRARGDYRTGSDIDLTLLGDDLTERDKLRLMTSIDDLWLPYMIDLSIFHHLRNAALKASIQRDGQQIYEA